MRVDGRDAGYVYVVLQGRDHDAVATRVTADNVLRTALWSTGLVALLGLVTGTAAFWPIMRPLRELTAVVRHFGSRGIGSLESQTATLERIARDDGEIATLSQAFVQAMRRIAKQWRELTLQNQQRHKLVANILHDLHTPLISLHGYLETLRLKAGILDDEERRHYLDIAPGQSRKAGRLAQELFELARLEYDTVKPEKENFVLVDLVWDMFQEFELAAEARRQQPKPDITSGLPVVSVDLDMIERVLTNLLDSAIRRTPVGGTIEMQLCPTNTGVAIQASNTGPGIPGKLQEGLSVHPMFMSGARSDGSRNGGLGLMIVRRILQLHGSKIRLVPQPGKGAAFCFQLTNAASG